ncbi:hypothetical protein [Nocardioides sp. CER19]|uniref:hypothetical protein n=1 Tax=Nocardioides sp. CER19 TaxID=3038538 RepID=UPI00244BE766|nr:hypothetical protein [Nocardioides sp. CER19]MDH2415286.1 hypothetical protein [Nocardioides sp. CER19]
MAATHSDLESTMESIRRIDPTDRGAVARAADDVLANQSKVKANLTGTQIRALGINGETPQTYWIRLGPDRRRPVESADALYAAQELLHDGPVRSSLTGGQMRALGIRPQQPVRHRFRPRVDG